MGRLRSRRLWGVAIVALASGVSWLACIGEDPMGVSASPEESGVGDAGDAGAGDAGAGDAGGPVEDSSPGDAATTGCRVDGQRFIDDFEARSDPLGCWSEYSTQSRFDASVEITPVSDGGGNTFRILISGDGSSGGGIDVGLKRVFDLNVPAVVTWRFRVDLPNLGGSQNGFTALTLSYLSSLGVATPIPVIVGAPNDTQLSVFLQGTPPQVVDLDSARWHTARLEVGSGIELCIDERPCTARVPPGAAPARVVELELGVSAGTILGTYEAIYDDVQVGPLE
jgi:hypothetical protein